MLLSLSLLCGCSLFSYGAYFVPKILRQFSVLLSAFSVQFYRQPSVFSPLLSAFSVQFYRHPSVFSPHSTEPSVFSPAPSVELSAITFQPSAPPPCSTVSIQCSVLLSAISFQSRPLIPLSAFSVQFYRQPSVLNPAPSFHCQPSVIALQSVFSLQPTKCNADYSCHSTQCHTGVVRVCYYKQ